MINCELTTKLLDAWTHPFALQTGMIILKIVCLLVAIAYYTIAERKIMAAVQRRRGPNVVGFWGLLQPLADGLKLVAKEMVIPTHANNRIFVIAPMMILTLGLVTWSILPFGCYDHSESISINHCVHIVSAKEAAFSGLTALALTARARTSKESTCFAILGVPWEILKPIIAHLIPYTQVAIYGVPLSPEEELLARQAAADAEFHAAVRELFVAFIEPNAISDVNYGVLVVLALSSLTVYGLIIAGWSSNSKYAFLGALRSAAQMISYEVSISLVLLPIIAMSGSLNFTKIVMAQEATVWFIAPLLPISIIFFISMIAETNRTPFDLPEAEAELVAGYNVEYSSITFAMFFLGEYGNMIAMSVLKAILFVGGWSFFGTFAPALALSAKALVFCFLFVLVRATFPRYRYDQLMDIGWKVFLPITTGYLILVVGLLLTFDAHPIVHELRPLGYDESNLFKFATKPLTN